jgi:TetR/AcrR family fatty acid metabolism transcriptional regulator
MLEKKEKKQCLILDAAFELILEKGYSNTKIIDIANKAGIGKGTFYEYFESKETLVLELINTKVMQDYMKIREKVEDIPSSRQKLAAYFQLEIDVTYKYKANLADFHNEFMRGNTEISMKVIEAVHGIALLQLELVYSIIKTGVESGEFKNVDPFAAAFCFMGSTSFFMSMLHFDLSPFNAGKFIYAANANSASAVLDCIFNGIANKDKML